MLTTWLHVLKSILLASLWILISVNSGFAQQEYSDSLKHIFLTAKEDSSKVAALARLSSYYSGLYPDSGLYYAETMIEFSKKKNYPYGEALGSFHKGSSILKQGDFTSAIQLGFKSLNLSKDLKEHRLAMLSKSNRLIGETYAVSGNSEKALHYLHKSIELQKQSGEYSDNSYQVWFTLAFSMLVQDKKDSAMLLLAKGWDIYSAAKDKRDIQPWIVSGNVYRFSGSLQKGEEYFRKGIELGKKYNSFFFVAAISNDMASLFYDLGKRDSCVQYLHQCLSLSQKYHYRVLEMNSSEFLYYLYDSHNADSTLKYGRIYIDAKNEVFSQEKMKQFQAASFEEEKKESELANAKTRYEDRLKMYTVIGVAAVFLVVAFILYRSNQYKQKSNSLLSQQKEKVEKTLDELKTTQTQLIQSEKMASLGQLTAGIAHEIQNPLNFVNNFSEVNTELIEELKKELAGGSKQGAVEIAEDIKSNEEKINFHGKRAADIVKGMLQHSRGSSGNKESTDINALCDEYLRLSYHGLRARDKSFNAKFETDFDLSLPQVNVVTQDIGRVILNLINNAFYAVTDRSKLQASGYEPQVTVATKSLGSKIEITVKDNGHGIPKNIVDKIFQPFFTTKPTGQGTGLGLSLSYDIVKAHGGELKVESKEGEGSEFAIKLPIV